MARQNIASLVQAAGWALPAPPVAASALYEPCVAYGGVCYFSGMVSVLPDAAHLGRLGEDLDLDQGRLAAECCALALLSRLEQALQGRLERLRRILRLTVYVNSGPGFHRQGEVADGASQLLVAVLGPRGRHARTSVGVSALPRRAAVELDAVIAVEPCAAG